MKSEAFVVAAMLAVLAPGHASASSIYTIDIPLVGGSITGTITTNGISPVLASDITGYDLDLTAGSSVFVLTPANSSVVDDKGLTSNASHLYFDYAGTNAFYVPTADGGVTAYLYLSRTTATAAVSPHLATKAYSGVVAIGTIVTPLPSAITMFGAGLGIIGWLGRQRRRKPADSDAS